MSQKPVLTHRYQDALVYAARLHADQLRKGTSVPYLAHLLSVSALVLENGGDEDQAIAALLHDAVEDQGGLDTLQDIEQRFGKRVARIVAGCTDSYETPKPAWRSRKEAYIEHLSSTTGDDLLVALADKVHNARTIVSDLKANGEHTWNKFKGGKQGTLWYYSALVNAFDEQSDSGLLSELAQLVDQMHVLASYE
jgi:(p)ppGpp synthase/HD superfamily hydrolase